MRPSPNGPDYHPGQRLHDYSGPRIIRLAKKALNYMPGGRWHTWRETHQTGEIALAEIKQSGPVAVTVIKPTERMPTTETVDISALPLNQRKQEEETEEADDDWDTPTVQVRAVRLPRLVAPIVLPDELPHDAQDRAYLQIVHPDATTEDLVQVSVAHYHNLTGLYPSIIFLSLPRYMALDAKYYIVGDTSISLDCEGLRDYDVLLKRY